MPESFIAKVIAFSLQECRNEGIDARIIPAEIDFKKVYGKDFECLNHQKPISVMLAEGSEIEVRMKKYLVQK